MNCKDEKLEEIKPKMNIKILFSVVFCEDKKIILFARLKKCSK
jgi:hypothetical protein